MAAVESINNCLNNHFESFLGKNIQAEPGKQAASKRGLLKPLSSLLCPHNVANAESSHFDFSI